MAFPWYDIPTQCCMTAEASSKQARVKAHNASAKPEQALSTAALEKTASAAQARRPANGSSLRSCPSGLQMAGGPAHTPLAA